MQNAPAFHLMDQHGTDVISACLWFCECELPFPTNDIPVCKGCGENDPNGPVFDPVHGVIHHFYQIHLAAKPGHGPDYGLPNKNIRFFSFVINRTPRTGHFVSKDFVNWAAMPVAIWNGLVNRLELLVYPYGICNCTLRMGHL